MRQLIMIATVLVLAACGGGGGGSDSTAATSGSSGGGGTSSATINHMPVISGTPASSVIAGQAYSFVPTSSDPDGNALTFTIQGKPAWATFNAATGALTGTPTSTNVGSYAAITIGVSDGAMSTSLAAFSIQVMATAAAGNRPPVISGTPTTTATTGTAYSFVPAASDPDGNALNFTIQNKPSWATFSTTTGALTGTPTTSNVGTFAAITISVSDGALSVSLAPFAVQVAQAVVTNQPPVISGSPATSVTAGAAYSFAPVASDPNGNALNFTIQNKPAWASFSTATGALTGTATVGSFANIVISVSDGTASAALAAFAITVTAPVVTGSATLSWTAPTQNSDGSALSDLAGYRVYMGTSATTLVQVASITNPATGSYAVTGLTAGIWYFSVSAVNSAGAESAQTAVASKTI